VALDKLWPYVLSGGMVLIYALLTGSYACVLMGLAIGLALRLLRKRIDRVLAPIIPCRDLVPRRIRAGLAWLLPIAVAYKITASPAILGYLTWLPNMTSEISIFTIITLITALIAFLFIREPQPRV
jgi:hypothetical protein